MTDELTGAVTGGNLAGSRGILSYRSGPVAVSNRLPKKLTQEIF
jgi:hypothetical protein